jgi:transcription elongation factor GreA
MADEKEYLTKDKFDELSKELDYLKKTRRKEIAENLEYAKSLGDLSENAEYHEARETQANLEDRIARLDAMLKSAEIVDTHGGDRVEFGSKVTVERESEKTPIVFQLVGSEESDVAGGHISIHSPIGEALLGKKRGEQVSVRTPKGNVIYKVVKVE